MNIKLRIAIYFLRRLGLNVWLKKEPHHIMVVAACCLESSITDAEHFLIWAKHQLNKNNDN